MSTEDLRKRYEAAMMHTYSDDAPDIALTHGTGVRVTDADGREYLDLAGGLAASALGHAHPEIAAAVARQAGELIHTSHQFLHPREVELAERLLDLIACDDGYPARSDAKVFLCNSGTEANEAALKLVRRRQGSARPVIVAAEKGFHGRTMGSLAVAGVPRIQEHFRPFGFDVRFVPFGDAAALAEAVREDTGGVLLEPIQGEAGVIPPPDGYLRAAREICDAAGAVFVLDEVQSGIGRTGRWFAYQHEGVVPDVLTVAKGLAGGLPVGACIGIGEFADTLGVSDHGNTFGGNPVVAAAALAVLDVIERDGLLERSAIVGDALAAGIEGVGDPLIAGVRGRGLWRAIVLSEPLGLEISDAANRAGFLVSAIRPEAIRLAPPLTMTKAEAAEFTSALPGILAEARASTATAAASAA